MDAFIDEVFGDDEPAERRARVLDDVPEQLKRLPLRAKLLLSDLFAERFEKGGSRPPAGGVAGRSVDGHPTGGTAPGT